MRLGQKNPRTRRWAQRGTRPRAAADLRTKSAYLFGAICPARGTGAAIVMPRADTEAMPHDLDEIARNLAPKAHAIVLLDQAGCIPQASYGYRKTSRYCRCRRNRPS
jgi:putative transposase